MRRRLHDMSLVLMTLISVGTIAGLLGAAKRYGVETRNRRIDIGIEYVEVDTLAQSSSQPILNVLRRMREAKVTSLIVSEDTLSTLEQTGAIHSGRIWLPDGRSRQTIEVYNPVTLERIRKAARLRGLPARTVWSDRLQVDEITTLFYCPVPPSAVADSRVVPMRMLAIHEDYAHLRTLGVGLPPAAVLAAYASGLTIVGRVANYPGVTVDGARATLENLKAQGAYLVIFNGDEVLGYRGLEHDVAGMLRDPAGPPLIVNDPTQRQGPTGLTYGAVEFSKQRGDELLSTALRGDYVRVHIIQSAELGLLDENEVVDRFVRAARERNIRFCYVRLITNAGADAVDRNVDMLAKISRGIERGGPLVGGGLKFGTARRFVSPNVSVGLYALMGLGVAAGTVWMFRLLAPLPSRSERALLLLLALLCVVLSVTGESGRRLVALLAGIAFPAAACLRVLPRIAAAKAQALNPRDCLVRAIHAIAHSSAITALGIVAVVGLLASRPFMMHTSQFLGIKLQHAAPLVLVGFAVLVGATPRSGERWMRYRQRVTSGLQQVSDEPARYGILLLSLLALAALVLVVARTGNDAGVGVSGTEMKARALLDRVLPVRPRTKEFLVGHPAFILAVAWWWRGRRKLALPCFVVGSLGQVSLLNTFCHIHTPLIVSVWRDVLGLIIGVVLGAILFLLFERFAPATGAISRQEDTVHDRNGPHMVG